ncbi:MAG: hypothetical protein JWN18_171 [Parcubacteria group bacterium]|nr:hypothetical protein [Parcubacteria group bacterium]
MGRKEWAEDADLNAQIDRSIESRRRLMDENGRLLSHLAYKAKHNDGFAYEEIALYCVKYGTGWDDLIEEGLQPDDLRRIQEAEPGNVIIRGYLSRDDMCGVLDTKGYDLTELQTEVPFGTVHAVAMDEDGASIYNVIASPPLIQ